MTFSNEISVLESCEKLFDFHAWPLGKIDPQGWLSNFTAEELPFARHLLSRFIFFSDRLIDNLFFSAVQNLSNLLRPAWRPLRDEIVAWNGFLDSAYITIVQGEDPNPSDSGWLFARKARQVLGISEEQLLEPHQALEAAKGGFSGPIIFVDDFVGSGEQFINTWTREYLRSGEVRSFATLAKNCAQRRFFYCSAIMTSQGHEQISKKIPEITMSAGNVIPGTYSLTDSNSELWPEGERDAGITFIKNASSRAGIPEYDGAVNDWRGYHSLGLGIAFEHSTPDATIPLFYWQKNNWKPLVLRK